MSERLGNSSASTPVALVHEFDRMLCHDVASSRRAQGLACNVWCGLLVLFGVDHQLTFLVRG
eukprot:2055273-Amphidinium_carterae.1